MSEKRKGIDFKAAKALLESRKGESTSKGSKGTNDVRWASLPEDTGTDFKFRFLPPYGGQPVPGKVVYKHYGLPEHAGIKGNITCFKTYGLECPICKVLEEYNNMDITKDFSGSSSYFNVLVLDNPNYDPKLPYILKASAFTYDWLLQQVLNSEVGDISDPEFGNNVVFRRKFKKGAFERVILRDSTPIDEDPTKIDTVLSSMYDFNLIWRSPDDSYLNIASDLAKDLKNIIEDRFSRLPEDAKNLDEPVKEVVNTKQRLDSERTSSVSEYSKSRKGTVSEETVSPINESKVTMPPGCKCENFGKHDLNKKCDICPYEYECEG